MSQMTALIFILVGLFATSGVGWAATPTITGLGSVGNTQYRLEPTDRLDLSYRYSPEYNQSIVIQPDGYASVTLIGPVKLAGLTVEQARETLLQELRTRLNDPEITLSLAEYVRPSFVVAGQVTSPGRFDLHGAVTAVEAIAMAGGFKDSSKTSKVILVRRFNAELAETRVLDLKKLMNSSRSRLDEYVQLQPGDLLIVPQNNVSRIERFVHWANVGVLANAIP